MVCQRRKDIYIFDPIANLNDNLSDYIEAKPPDKIFNKWEQSTIKQNTL